MSTLADKVYSVVADDPDNLIYSLHSWPPRETSLEDFELDVMDWGFLYGIAFAIALSENPFQTRSALADEADRAAREARQRWAGDTWRANFDQAARLRDEAVTA